MFRLTYSIDKEKDELEFTADLSKGLLFADFDIGNGTVSDLGLEKWDGTKFACVDIWDSEYYDIVEKFVKSMPKPRRIILKNVARTGNLASSEIDDLSIESRAGDMEFYPVMANLHLLNLVDLHFEPDFFVKNGSIFMAALASSSLSTLTMTNITPTEPFYLLFEKKKSKSLLYLTELNLENVPMPKQLPPNLTELCIFRMELKFNTDFPISLTRLDLPQNNLRELKTLARAIAHLLQLNFLGLDDNNFCPRELVYIFRLTQLTTLKCVSARGTSEPLRQDISLLLHALETNMALVELNLSPAHVPPALQNRLNVNCHFAESKVGKSQLMIIENSDGETFNVDPRSKRLQTIANFFNGK